MKKKVMSLLLVGMIALQSTVLVHAEDLVIVEDIPDVADTQEELVENMEADVAEENLIVELETEIQINISDTGESESDFEEESTAAAEKEFVEDTIAEQIILDEEEVYAEVEVENQSVFEAESTPDTEFVYDELSAEYSDIDETVLIIYAYTGTDSIVRIPEVIDGKKVYALSREAFSGNTSIEEVYLPKNMKKIETNSFYGCTNLKK